MKIHYGNAKMAKILSDERLIKATYTKYYKRLINALSEIIATDCLNDIPTVPPRKRHKLFGNYADCWGICINENYRIVIRPYGIFDINNLKTITEIEILRIEDYH